MGNKRISLTKIIKKLTWCEKTFYFFLLLIAFMITLNYAKNYHGIKENFEKRGELVVKRGNNVYDDFYADIYDKLVFCQQKNEFELGTMKKITKLSKTSNILDIGSGTGHHVAEFTGNGFKAQGIDISPSMVKVSKDKYPESKYVVGDALNGMTFPQQSFTHLTCLYFTVYYIKNKRLFFENCYNWLAPGGYLLLHLVDRDNFDPILPAGDPLTIISAQKYAKERITSSAVKFKGYDYRSNFDYQPKKDLALLNEEFKNNKTGDIRKNEHVLYMPTQKYILSLAKDIGFILHSKNSMVKCQYDKQYIYILQKPN